MLKNLLNGFLRLLVLALLNQNQCFTQIFNNFRRWFVRLSEQFLHIVEYNTSCLKLIKKKAEKMEKKYGMTMESIYVNLMNKNSFFYWKFGE